MLIDEVDNEQRGFSGELLGSQPSSVLDREFGPWLKPRKGHIASRGSGGYRGGGHGGSCSGGHGGTRLPTSGGSCGDDGPDPEAWLPAWTSSGHVADKSYMQETHGASSGRGGKAGASRAFSVPIPEEPSPVETLPVASLPIDDVSGSPEEQPPLVSPEKQPPLKFPPSSGCSSPAEKQSSIVPVLSPGNPFTDGSRCFLGRPFGDLTHL